MQNALKSNENETKIIKFEKKDKMSKTNFRLEINKHLDKATDLRLFHYIEAKSFFNNESLEYKEISFKVSDFAKEYNLSRQMVAKSIKYLKEKNIILIKKEYPGYKIKLNNLSGIMQEGKPQFTFKNNKEGKPQFTKKGNHSLQEGKPQFTFNPPQTIENTGNTATPITLLNNNINIISKKDKDFLKEKYLKLKPNNQEWIEKVNTFFTDIERSVLKDWYEARKYIDTSKIQSITWHLYENLINGQPLPQDYLKAKNEKWKQEKFSFWKPLLEKFSDTALVQRNIKLDNFENRLTEFVNNLLSTLDFSKEFKSSGIDFKSNPDNELKYIAALKKLDLVYKSLPELNSLKDLVSLVLNTPKLKNKGMFLRKIQQENINSHIGRVSCIGNYQSDLETYV